MSLRTLGTSAALAAVTALGIWTAVADDAAPEAAVSSPSGGVTATGTSVTGVLRPAGVVTGSLVVRNSGTVAVQVGDVAFAPPTGDGCEASGVVLAPTVPLDRTAPLEVPAGGTSTLEWTAFMDGSGEHACQGVTLTSVVSLDGERAGTVAVAAGRLDRPSAPTGGATTSSRATVRWSASSAATPAYVLERSPVGTDDWRPACGSSARRPLWTTSCTDTGLAASTGYRYRVTVRSGHWRATSRPGEPVTTSAEARR